MTYNAFDMLLTARQFGSHSGFTVDETQSWTYDAQLRLCRHVAPETGATLYSYNAVGQMLSLARGMSPTAACGSAPSSAKTVHGYDSIGRLTSVDYPDSSPDVTMGYDANGNLLTANRGTTAWTYTYDDMNQLLSETLVVDGRTYALSHEYLSDGRHDAMTYPGGRRIQYMPDGHGRPTRAMHNTTSFVHSATYHPSGQLQTMDYGNGLALTHTFNARQQITEVDINGGGVTAFDHTYSYDANGRVSDITVNFFPSESRSFTYDGLGRLSTASGPWGAGSYTYDLLNNIRSKSLGADTVEIEYNANNQVHRARDTRDGNIWRLYGHDARGNVIDNSRLQFTYDRSDQPTAISGAATASFVYDAHNRRVKQTIDGETIYSVYSSNGTLFYRDNVTTGEVTEYLTLGSTTHVRLETIGGTTSHNYLHNDHLGSASMATSSSRLVRWWESYSPFGEPLRNPPGNHDDQGYTSHIRDNATGLNYMQARYYDPVIGRFLSNDPVGFASGGPDYFNRYSYTSNNPVNFIDPNGMCTGSRIKNDNGTCASTGGNTTGLSGTAQGLAVKRARAKQQRENDTTFRLSYPQPPHGEWDPGCTTFNGTLACPPGHSVGAIRADYQLGPPGVPQLVSSKISLASELIARGLRMSAREAAGEAADLLIDELLLPEGTATITLRTGNGDFSTGRFGTNIFDQNATETIRFADRHSWTTVWIMPYPGRTLVQTQFLGASSLNVRYTLYPAHTPYTPTPCSSGSLC